MRPSVGLLIPLLLVGTSTATGQQLPVDSILALTHRWLGPATLERLQALRAVAEVQGPSGQLQTVVRSRLGGPVRFEQFSATGPQVVAGIGAGGAWTWSLERNRAEPLAPERADAIASHAFHLLAAFPSSRWAPLGDARLEVAEGDTLWRLDLRDRLGSTVSVRYARDGRPVDLLLVNHGEGVRDVRVRLFGWPTGEELRLFRYAVILHGSQTWLYHYLVLEPDRSGPAVFEASPALDGPRKRDREEGCP